MAKEQQALELSILHYIDAHAEATQRQLSEHAGVSLGSVNLVLKKLVKSGWVKISRLQSNSVKYFLTPAGLANKIERTYRYVIRTYDEIERIKGRIVLIANHIATTTESEGLFFLGKDDELRQIINDLIRSDRFNTKAQLFETIEQVKEDSSYTSSTPVVIWNKEMECLLDQHHLQWVNVMGMMVL